MMMKRTKRARSSLTVAKYFSASGHILSCCELFEELKSLTIEPLEVSKTNESLDNVPLTDSSCEETVIGSSSQDNNNPGDKQVTVVVPLLTSSYVKNMLAEAMTEKQENVSAASSSLERPREHSPLSSERYEIIIGYQIIEFKIFFYFAVGPIW